MAKAKTAAPTKTKPCDRFIKVIGLTKVAIEQCSGFITMGQNYLPCQERDKHVMRYPTGWCQNGWHEGIKAKNAVGNPVPTCKMYLTCACKCHRDLDLMFNMAEKMRELVNKSEYHTPARTWWMPSDEPLAPLSTVAVAGAPVMVESAAPGYVPPTMAREYGPTATGRAARGELESWVKTKCDEWMIEKYQFPCTPAWLSEEIAEWQEVKAPSVGAINAVFNRWKDLDFAHIRTKPVRFTGYTEAGVQYGLEGLKVRRKQQKRLMESALKRGVR